MIYLFDTNVVSTLHDLKHPFHGSVRNRMRQLHGEAKVLVSILALFELEYSAQCCSDNDKSVQIKKLIDTVLADFDYENLSLEDSKYFARIKSKIKMKYKISRENIKKLSIDLMIASSAISRGAIFVTLDKKIAEKVQAIEKDFVFENWAEVV